MLNEREKQLSAHWLDEASDMYANHGCNDVSEKVWDGWVTVSRHIIEATAVDTYNGLLKKGIVLKNDKNAR